MPIDNSADAIRAIKKHVLERMKHRIDDKESLNLMLATAMLEDGDWHLALQTLGIDRGTTVVKQTKNRPRR